MDEQQHLQPLDAKVLRLFVNYFNRHAVEGPWTWINGELRDRWGVLAIREDGVHSPELIHAIGAEVAARG